MAEALKAAVERLTRFADEWPGNDIAIDIKAVIAALAPPAVGVAEPVASEWRVKETYHDEMDVTVYLVEGTDGEPLCHV
ncbi:MAG: hypothetical protein EON59_17745, partial [Alphaproteobacteria bacterium]